MAYKKHALIVAPIFREAFQQLQSDTLGDGDIPPHLHEGLWFPIGKREGADSISAVRDLELPNEDCKILERMHTLVLDEVAADQIRPTQQAFISGGDIMHNVVGVHEEFVGSLSNRRLRLILLIDFTKFFNYASHAWSNRVWAAFRLPAGLRRSIARLVEIQVAILLYAGMAFEAAQWLSGYRQGGPLSAIILVITIAPFLHALTMIPNVRAVYGFCDDCEVSLVGLAAVPAIRATISEFEAASGHSVHPTKTKWLPNRRMSHVEINKLRERWPDAAIIDRETILGTPLGHGVTSTDFAAKSIAEFTARLSVVKRINMSFTMRLLTCLN